MPSSLPRALVVATLAVASLPACESATEPEVVTGEWTLASVDDDPVPALLDEGEGYIYEVVSGTLTLTAGGSWSYVETNRTTVGENETFGETTTTGTWAVDGDALTLSRNAGGDPALGTLDGDTLTVEAPDGTGEGTRTLVFER